MQQPRTTYAATLTTAGSLTKRYLQALAATLSTAGALSKRPQMMAVATVTSSGNLKGYVSKTVAGTVTTASAVLHRILKSLVGTLTTAGALSQTKVVLLNMAGSLTTAAALRMWVNKSLAGTLNTSGTFAGIKQLVIMLAATLNTAGALCNRGQTMSVGSLASLTALGHRPLKAITASLGSIGTLTFRVSESPRATLSVQGTLTTALNAVMINAIRLVVSFFRQSTLRFAMATFEFDERATPKLKSTLTDPDGVAIPVASLYSFELTLFSVHTGNPINSRNHQNVLNQNGVTITSAGNPLVTTVQWQTVMADMIIEKPTLLKEHHIALFEWTWDGGNKSGKTEINIYVKNLSKVS